MIGHMWFDGGNRDGNPGRAASAFWLKCESGTYMDAWPLEKATNNVAEYLGLIGGLSFALKIGVTEIAVHGDSQLVIYQVNGRYKAKDYVMAALRDQVKYLLSQFETVVEVSWHGRADNLADEGTEKVLGKRSR